MFESKVERYAVARYVILMLREPPGDNGLQGDEYGFVGIGEVLRKIAPRYPDVTLEQIHEIAEKDAQNRFHIDDGKIRARAGHRFDVALPSEPVEPPEYLYHGTTEGAAGSILSTGVLKMGKAYVHLANTPERARRTGLRKGSRPIVLKINAKIAFDANLRFWKSGQVAQDGEIYLSDEIPAEYVSWVGEPL